MPSMLAEELLIFVHAQHCVMSSRHLSISQDAHEMHTWNVLGYSSPWVDSASSMNLLRGSSQVALSLNNLAALLRKMSKGEQAEKLYMRSLSIREEALGPDHPQVPIQPTHQTPQHLSLCNTALVALTAVLHHQSPPSAAWH